MYKKFQKRIDSYGRENMEKEVSILRSIRDKLIKDCKIQEHRSENKEKTEAKNYSYSVPFNRNAIHYIAR